MPILDFDAEDLDTLEAYIVAVEKLAETRGDDPYELLVTKRNELAYELLERALFAHSLQTNKV